jgi:16S rRNA processing protein RimM
MRTPEGYVAVGQIVGAHGIRGEVKVELLTDHPERYDPGRSLYMEDPPGVMRVHVNGSRPHKGFMLVQLAEVRDRTAAQALQGRLLLIADSEIMPLSEHENYLHDLIGLEVVAEDGRPLGRVVEILSTKANDVYVVAGEDGEVLLPALREVVTEVDLGARRMLVRVPDGLMG